MVIIIIGWSFANAKHFSKYEMGNKTHKLKQKEISWSHEFAANCANELVIPTADKCLDVPSNNFCVNGSSEYWTGILPSLSLTNAPDG